MPMVRKPASAATLTSSGGVVSRTVRCAREIGLGLTREIVPRPSASGAPVSACPRSTLDPERHRHLAVHVRRESEVVLSATECAEAEMAVGDERTHAARLGEGQGPAVVVLAAFGIEAVGMRRDVAEYVKSVRRKAWMRRSGFDGAVTQALGFVEVAEKERGSTQGMVRLSRPVGCSPGGVTIEKLLAFVEPDERRVHVAHLGQDPGG